MKKLVALLLFIFLLFGLYIVISRRPHSYSVSYSIKGTNIKEEYDNAKKVYKFTFDDNEEEYLFSIKADYYTKKKLIKNLSKEDNCITINSYLIDHYAICKKDGEYFSNFYGEKINTKASDTFEGISIYDLMDHTIMVWDYKKLIGLKKKNYSKINIFNNDVYNMNLYYQLDNYLVLPNYDENYIFSSIYLINSENFKINKINLNIDLYYDSYFLGNYDDDIYLYDFKKETEYRLNPFKKKIVKNRFEYYDGNSWIKTSKKELDKGDIKFNNNDEFYFYVDDNLLEYHTPSYNVKITNYKVDYLVKSNEKEAFFISKGILYYVNIYSGINKIVGYKEWNYNTGNVFVF